MTEQQVARIRQTNDIYEMRNLDPDSKKKLVTLEEKIYEISDQEFMDKLDAYNKIRQHCIGKKGFMAREAGCVLNNAMQYRLEQINEKLSHKR